MVTGCTREADSELPDAYREVRVPTERIDSAEAIERGRVLFVQYCAFCHGERGDGHGPRSANLSSDPRDFTESSWRDGTSARKTFFAIREGVRGTAMPSWKSLSQDDCWDLAAYVLSLSG